MTRLIVEPTGERNYGPCQCCGNESRCVWGLVSTPSEALAAYYVHWTVGRVADHGANLDLIVGRWGEEATAADRRLVALEYRLLDRGPAVMVIDAARRGGRMIPRWLAGRSRVAR